MNPEQLKVWIEDKGVTVRQPRTGSDREISYKLTARGKPAITLKTDANGEFSGEELGKLHEWMGQPQDMPGIGRIPVPIGTAIAIAKRLSGVKGDIIWAPEDPERNNDRWAIMTERGQTIYACEVTPEERSAISRGEAGQRKIPTEMVGNILARSAQLLFQEERITYEERVTAMQRELERPEVAAAFTTRGYLQLEALVQDAESTSASYHYPRSFTLPKKTSTPTELDDLVDLGAGEDFFVTRTEYNADATGSTGALNRLRYVYTVYDKAVARPKTIRVYEQESFYGEKTARITYEGVAETAAILRKGYPQDGAERAQGFTERTVFDRGLPTEEAKAAIRGYSTFLSVSDEFRNEFSTIKWREGKSPSEGV
jgi:hypothetical protein